MTGSLFINPSAFEAALQSAFFARSVANDAQAAAFERFAQLRLPNRRVEGWKWSDFNAVLRSVEPANEAAPPVEPAPSVFAALEPLEFRIVNGRIELPEGDLPEGIVFGVIDSMATIPELDSHAIIALNVAMNRKALGIQIYPGVQFKRPIHIRHIVDRAAPVFCQTLMRLGENASGHIIETFEGEGAPLYSHVCHMALRDGAVFNRTALQDMGAGAVVHSAYAAKVDAGATYNQTSLSTGARLARHETIVHFWGKECSANIDSVALVSGERHNDVTTIVEHKAPGCVTRQTHKGVATDRGRNVFQGKFLVERPAQKTDAKMTANAMLLSDMAEANHKPELEIYADDVECAHGSTAGALDDDALFYLRQRGLTEHQARALLIEAFVGVVIDGVKDEQVRGVLAGRVRNWLEAV